MIVDKTWYKDGLWKDYLFELTTLDISGVIHFFGLIDLLVLHFQEHG